MNLSNARALVTGGSRGIGYGIAEALVQKGARVAILSRDCNAVEEAAARLRAVPIAGNVAVEADAVRAVETAVRELGGLDLLVNNAGFGRFRPLVDLELADLQEIFAVNVAGAMLMAREAARHFVAQQSGHIVNISSTSGLRGGQGSTAYAGSKFALRGMTECWREELRRHNIRVTLVNPSEVQTEFFSAAGLAAREPSPRKLRPEDIAAAVIGALEMDDRGFIPEFSVFATNPF